MASIRKQGDCYEIRECLVTGRGPRQLSLASFRGVLTPEILDRAELKARKPLERTKLVARALRMGIPVCEHRRHPEARGLLAALQRGAELEPTMVKLLVAALGRLECRAVPAHLVDAAEWIGQPERERGAALRGLLRTLPRDALDEKIVAIERGLGRAEIPHAFGGANAHAYYGTPRATAEIDLNVFVPASRASDVLAALGELGASTSNSKRVGRIERESQARILWEKTPIDLFFSYDPLHDSSMQRRRLVDFGRDAIHVLSAEDLMVYKTVFDRETDWRDIAEMIYATDRSLDFGYVRSWLGRIVSDDDRQVERFERLVQTGGQDLGLMQ
jgi:hypothetical protein